MQKYIEDINQKIEKLKEMEPTPERAHYMHDLIYVKRHLMHPDGHMPVGEMHNGDPHKSYFGGGM